MAALLENIDTVTPNENDTKVAKETSRALSKFGAQDLALRIAENGKKIVLPASAVRALIKLLEVMSEGNAVTLIPIHAELTTQQAADLLDVSRPFLIRQLAPDGPIPCRMVGSHRRILFADLIAYKERMHADRLKALQALADEGQDLNPDY